MSDYHGRAKRAIGQLMGRQVVMQCITFAGGVVLARTLGPGPFGLYIISLFVVGLFALLGDFGLAPSFIQRKAELTAHDLQVGFTLQQILITAMVAALFAVAPLLSRWLYPGQPEVVWLVRALSFNLYLSSWRTMSAIQLEREVKFGQLARIEVLETLLYQALAVGLSLAGCGTWSFVAAAMAQGLLGTVLIYAAAPWPVRLRWDWPVARDLIRFGVPFQLQMILNGVGGWVTPLVVGRLVGPVGVGYLTWAAANGRKPLMVTDNIMRVGFPHVSRLQGDLAEVERLVVRYLTFSILPAGLWFAGIYCCVPAAVQWVYKPQWVPASWALVLYAAVLPIDMVGMVAAVTLNALGRVPVATLVVTCRTVANVLGAIGLVVWWPTANRINAVPVAYLVTSALSLPWMLAFIRPGALRRIAWSLGWMSVPLVIAIVIGLGTSLISAHAGLPLQVLATGIATGLAYACATLVMAPPWVRHLIARGFRPTVAAASTDGQPVIV